MKRHCDASILCQEPRIQKLKTNALNLIYENLLKYLII